MNNRPDKLTFSVAEFLDIYIYICVFFCVRNVRSIRVM
jgi:hypothetical protein